MPVGSITKFSGPLVVALAHARQCIKDLKMAKRRNEGTELETGRTDSGEAVYTILTFTYTEKLMEVFWKTLFILPESVWVLRRFLGS